MTGSEWRVNIALGFDQFVNTWFRGYADESISARAWRNHRAKKRWAVARRVIDALFFWQDSHCYHAYESEMLRKHLPKEYRKWS